MQQMIQIKGNVRVWYGKACILIDIPEPLPILIVTLP